MNQLVHFAGKRGIMATKPKQDEVQRVVDALTEDEIKQLRKENPFRKERNDKIRELLNRGVKTNVVAEVSGLYEGSILRIKHCRCKH